MRSETLKQQPEDPEGEEDGIGGSQKEAAVELQDRQAVRGRERAVHC
jgi:hypothetical protein